MAAELNESGYESPTKRHGAHTPLDTITIKDNVHGYIRVPPLCRMIMDTPQFARLKSVKQLGCCHYVYPTSTHTRFDHSLGVMHLASKFYVALTESHPDLYSPVDHLCVQVAGLMHDMGHGPFSHLWEHFVSEADPGCGWRHEQSSLDMFLYLVRKNDIPLMEWEVGARDVEFILELVKREPLVMKDDWPYKGRGQEKAFLYEIIANYKSGIDVDKMDYLHRDGKAMGLPVTFDIERYFHSASIAWNSRGTSFISLRKGMEDPVLVYQDRSRLHRKGYQHKTVKVIERMMLDMLLAADPFLDIVKDDEGGLVRMSQAWRNPEEFDVLSDEFVEKSIQHSRGASLAAARDILERIHTRELYSVVFSKDYLLFDKMCQEKLVKMAKFGQGKLVEGDLAVLFKNVNMGSGSPLEEAVFNNTTRPGVHYTLKKDSDIVRNLVPGATSLITVMVVCRKKGEEASSEASLLAREWAKIIELEEGVVAAEDMLVPKEM
eukprot:GFUD01044839.1.p1 GENE.GFUD01044839.1~~GFUD01044839.1.p1  ORF type:complete len:491 (-),score=159.76 GFUD01044839.1:168-1640(-)